MTDGMTTDEIALDPDNDGLSAVRDGSRRQSAQQRAYEHLKEQLIAGTLDDGTFLTESELAQELGISRTPVREALRRLDAENLITLVPARGAFVPQTTERMIREVMDVREVLETAAVLRIDHSAIPTLLPKLDSYLDHQERLTEKARAFISQDRHFHQTIVDAAANRTLSEFYGSMRDRQMRMGLSAVRHRPDRILAAIAEHRAIVDALRSVDTNAAAACTTVHLRNTLQALLSGLES